MKRVLAVLLVFLLLLCGCSDNGMSLNEEYPNKGKLSSGIWISYMEINNMLTSQNGFEKEIEAVAENCKSL